MTWSIQVNPKTKAIRIVRDEEVVAQLPREESYEFMDAIKRFQERYGYVFNQYSDYLDIGDLAEAKNDGDICAINFDGCKMMQFGNCTIRAEWVFKDGSVHYLDYTFEDNFDNGYLWNGSLTIAELRKCFEHDVLVSLKAIPNFVVHFNNEDITELLFSDELHEKIYLEENYDS